MPQLESEFFLSQVVWLAISFAVLYLLMAKVALPRIDDILQTRHDRITADLERAEAFRREAAGVAAEYDAAIAQARDEAARLAAGAGEAARASVAARIAEVEQRLTEEADAAEKRIQAATAAAMAELKALAVDIAQSTTGRLMDAAPDQAAVAKAVADEMTERPGV